jgi:hypothetical protein
MDSGRQAGVLSFRARARSLRGPPGGIRNDISYKVMLIGKAEMHIELELATVGQAADVILAALAPVGG